MNQRKKLFLAIIVVFLIGSGISKVGAQDSNKDVAQVTQEETSFSGDEKTDLIFNKSRSTQKILDLKVLYRDQIEAYRNSDKQFNIAKTHYFNVLTLISLEELVGSTKLAMSDRLKVLITYLELLSATLEDTTGVELALKEESLKQIRATIIALKLHQEDIALAKDRATFNLLADDFSLFVESYEQVSYRALSLIRIGQIQAVYDAATIIDADIKKSKEGEDVGAVVESKRVRAFQEIQRNFTITNEGLIKLNDKVISREAEDFGRNFYEDTLVNLEPIYIQMSKSLDHLEELLKL
ncbi:MAG: hypothetical protein COZ34_02475 [Candidatus Pacebacteria bacterium CG_4_10_14_3_um_filter_34_15]|nr:hypothetical protein [Candidatus Pacearchaeota archaeon]NCQ65613.1 hypothetical protein [Candidatus Paceibacterota bacterium]OIO44908.1 MAG: hypothetical protein AUJ41_01475 [Candidatus Pacebacteria bacterium CG1_02_43_31]PIQ80537.1 MAG: hypothetical protein COV78_05070 [Candidatus Pacebacteria bacterium CG11_big_fil_rev_8_21_14_0_20_34_55]PIX81583.1 MAG: hypothetical protein COZ34_02475 [Candidatus Pacebacteria bacterium CG_4_10_14_3_um_filter_34_15]PJC44172.1 MAG: hypothetical protein CO0